MPIVLVVRTHNYWPTEYSTYEQPDVTHLNELIAVIYTEKETFIFGSTQQLNELVGNSVSISPTLEIENLDLDKDGKNEEIKMKLSLSGLADDIRSIVIIQSLKYAISEKVKAQFKLPFYALFEVPYGFRKFNVQGQLNLEQ